MISNFSIEIEKARSTSIMYSSNKNIHGNKIYANKVHAFVKHYGRCAYEYLWKKFCASHS
jgi:hypothetical protein